MGLLAWYYSQSLLKSFLQTCQTLFGFFTLFNDASASGNADAFQLQEFSHEWRDPETAPQASILSSVNSYHTGHNQ